METPSNGESAKNTKKSNTNTERLSLLKARLSVAKAFCKKPHDAWKKFISEYNIEDFKDTDEIRDKVRIGYIFRKIESEIPSIFDDQPDLFIKGRGKKVKDLLPLIEGTYDWLWDVQRLEEKVEDAGVYFELLGMAFISSPWVTKNKKILQMQNQPATDKQGNPIIDPVTGQQQIVQVPVEYEVSVIDWPMANLEDPFKVYFSPETQFAPILNYQTCPYYFKEMVIGKEEVKARWGKEVDANETLKLDEVNLYKEENQQVMKDDLKRVTVYEYYGSLPEDMAKDVKGTDGKIVTWEYDKEYHIFMTNNEELLVEECSYPYKPLFVLGNYGLANKFFKFGDAKHLMPLVQELEKYRSMILEHTRKTAHPKGLIPSGANIDENKWRDPRSGIYTVYEGANPPAYLTPPPLGREVATGIDVVRTDLEKTAGSFDLTSGSGQSTVKTPRGIQVYSEAADKGVRRKRKKIARFIREIIIFQFQQIAQNWKPEDNKTISIIDSGIDQQIQVNQEVLDILKGVNDFYHLDIEIESLSVNRVQMKQDALNLWDSVKDHPDIFNLVEVAKDLLQNGYTKKDADRYLLTEEERASLAQKQPEQPKVNVAIKADATTPPGAALLENEGLLRPGQGTQSVVNNQVMEAEKQQITPQGSQNDASTSPLIANNQS